MPDPAEIRAALVGDVLSEEEKSQLWTDAKDDGVSIDFAEPQSWMVSGEGELAMEEAPQAEPPYPPPAMPPPPFAEGTLPPSVTEAKGYPEEELGFLKGFGAAEVAEPTLSDEDLAKLKTMDRHAKASFKESRLKAALEDEEIAAGGFTPDTSLRNFTGDKLYDVPPTVGDISKVDVQALDTVLPSAMGYGIIPEQQFRHKQPYLYQEPSVRETIKHFERMADGPYKTAAIKSIDKLGEKSRHWKYYADIRWKAVYNVFQEEINKGNAEAAVRVSQMEPRTAGEVMTWITGIASPSYDALIGGIDAALTLGYVTQSKRGTSPFAAVRKLKDVGVLPESESLTAMADIPALAFGAEFGGHLLPIGAGGLALKGAKKGAEAMLSSGLVGNRILAEIAAGTPAGMAVGVGQEAIETGFDIASADRLGLYEEAQELEDSAFSRLKGRALSEAYLGVLGPVAPELIGAAGRAGARSLEEGASIAGPEMEKALKNIDIAEQPRILPGDIAGEARGRRPLRTLRSPKAYKEAQKESRGEYAALQQKTPGAKKSTAGAETIQSERFAQTLIDPLNAQRKATKARIGKENRTFYDSEAGRTPVDTTEFVEKFRALIDNYKREGEALPYVETADLEDAYRKFGQITGVKEIGGKSYSILEPIMVTAEQFDDILKGLDAKMGAARNRSGKHDWRLNEVRAALIEVYDKFDVKAPLGTEKWRAVKGRHHKEMLADESLMRRAGLPKDVARLDADDYDQISAMVNYVAKNPGNDAVIADIVVDNPALLKEFEKLSQIVGWEQLRGRGGITATPADVAAGRRGAFRAGRLISDPLFQAMDLMRGHGTMVGVAGPDPYDKVNELAREVLGTDAERKMRDMSHQTPKQRDAFIKIMDAVRKGAER